jgi:hypothetical protein
MARTYVYDKYTRCLATIAKEAIIARPLMGCSHKVAAEKLSFWEVQAIVA